jgi:hypothetical protein
MEGYRICVRPKTCLKLWEMMYLGSLGPSPYLSLLARRSCTIVHNSVTLRYGNLTLTEVVYFPNSVTTSDNTDTPTSLVRESAMLSLVVRN